MSDDRRLPRGNSSRRLLLAALAALLTLGAAPRAAAHEVPGEMRIHALVKPEAERLHVLVRVPLELLLGLNLPKRGPGYLDLPAAEQAMPKALQAIAAELAFFEDDRRLAFLRGEGRISLPSDKSFASFEEALALVRGERLPASTDVFWNQGYFDAYFEYPVSSARGSLGVDFSVSPGLGERLKLDLRFHAAGGAVRAFEIPTAAGRADLDPRWHRAAWSFVKSGFVHILDGLDHLLFLLCLVMPFRRLSWTLVGVITAFTLAHSVTLIAAAYGLVPKGAWFAPLVEALIAASIIYMALENLVRPNLRRRWLVTALFGLVHGFGFSFMLQNRLQFAGEHLLASLLAFNIGIELGQLAFIGVAIPLLAFLFAKAPLDERLIVAVISGFVIHTAWHWLAERWDTLTKAQWPAIDPFVVALWAVPLAALGVLVWTAPGAALRRRLRMVAVVLLRARVQRDR